MTRCDTCDVKTDVGCDSCGTGMCSFCFKDHECEIGAPRDVISPVEARRIYEIVNASKNFAPGRMPVLFTPTEELLAFLQVTLIDVIDEIPLSLKAMAPEVATSVMLAAIINLRVRQMKNALLSEIRRDTRSHIRRALKKVYRQEKEKLEQTQNIIFSNAKDVLKRSVILPQGQSLEGFVRAFCDKLVREGPFPDFERSDFTSRERVYPKSQKMVRNPWEWKRDESGLFYKESGLITYKSPPTQFYGAKGQPRQPIVTRVRIIFREENGEVFAEASITTDQQSPGLGDYTSSNSFEFSHLDRRNNGVTFREAQEEELFTAPNERGQRFLRMVDEDTDFKHFNLSGPTKKRYTDAGELLQDILNLPREDEERIVEVISGGKWQYEQVN